MGYPAHRAVGVQFEDHLACSRVSLRFGPFGGGGHKPSLVGNTWIGVCQQPLALILLQNDRDTNGSRIVIQIGGVYTFCQEEGMLFQKYRNRNGRCIDTF